MLRQWTVNLVRERVNEDSRILKNWANKEIKQVRELFKVPGIIGTGAAASDEEVSPGGKPRGKRLTAADSTVS